MVVAVVNLIKNVLVSFLANEENKYITDHEGHRIVVQDDSVNNLQKN